MILLLQKVLLVRACLKLREILSLKGKGIPEGKKYGLSPVGGDKNRPSRQETGWRGGDHIGSLNPKFLSL